MDNATTSTVREQSFLDGGPAEIRRPQLRAPSFGTRAQRFGDHDIAHIQSTDVADLSRQIRDWQTEHAQLRSGALTTTGLMIPLGPVLVASITFGGSLLHRATPPAGCLSIVLRGRDCDRIVFRGEALTDDQCVVLCSGADAEAVSRGQSVVVAASVSDEAWRAAPHWMGTCSLAVGRGAQLRTPGSRWNASVRRGIEWIVGAFVTYPECVNSVAIRASVADVMLARLHGPVDITTGIRTGRREHMHRRIAVQRARRFIHDNLTSPIRLAELCLNAHAQARSLEYGFQETFGMSPVSYIKMLRLNWVHRLLLSPDTAQRTITEIALDSGFWHLSQFALDYRNFFGESPSVTHQRAIQSLSR